MVAKIIGREFIKLATVRHEALAASLMALLLATPLAQSAQAAVDAKALIRQTETLYQGHSSHSVFKMKVVTAAWTREMTIEAWSEGRDKMLSRILAPQKDAGTATLKVGSDLWNYLPKIDRLMKIPTSLMGDRWMGSHLTNDDLVKSTKIDDLYDMKVQSESGGAVSIVATPKPNAAVVWGRIIYDLDTQRHLPVTVRYFDEDGALVRTLSFEDPHRIAGHWLPLRLRFVPADPPGEYTQVQYESLEFDPPLSKDRFSVRSLRK